MTAHRVETIIGKDGKLTVDHLPLAAGSRVELIILVKDAVAVVGDRYPLRGKSYRYDEPFAPVAAEDWEAIR